MNAQAIRHWRVAPSPWIILTASCFILLVSMGWRYSFGVFSKGPPGDRGRRPCQPMNQVLSMPAIRHRRWAPGKVLLGVVVVLAFTALVGAVISPVLTPLVEWRRPVEVGHPTGTTKLIEDKAAHLQVGRRAGDWIEIGLLSALTCHGGPLLSGNGQSQSRRAPD